MTKFPDAFVNQIRTLLGAKSESFFLALDEIPITSIRKNPFKPSTIFNDEEKVEWCADGKYLAIRPSFIADPLFHAGAYYVQESSSMFLYQVLKQILSQINKPVKVLDLCAAPGGKSTLINSLLNKNDLLVSNEIIKSRIDVLDENLMRWGQSNVFISNNDAKDFLPLKSYFDIILVDAPCSGEGLFRKDKKAIDEWSENNIEICVGRQKRILNDILPSLKPGGFIIYSTCTFNQKENEENVEWLINNHQLFPTEIVYPHPLISSSPHFLIPPSSIITSSNYSFRFYPHQVKGEGLFMACLQKPFDDSITQQNKFREQPLSFVHRKNLDEPSSWINNADEFDFIEWNKNIHAIRKNQVQDLKILAHYLHLKNAGIKMGEIVNQKLIPNHHLALSTDLSHAIKTIDITLEEARKYLKKDTLVLTQKHEQGIYLLCFEGLGIGWVKVLQNRINNYLPTHLRVLKDI